MSVARRILLAAAIVMVAGLPTVVASFAAQAQTQSGGYDVARCGAPPGKTYLTYDDANYSHPYAVVRLAEAAQNMHVGLGIFHVSSVTHSYFASTGVSIPHRLRLKGMYVNNHTFDHPNLTTLSVSGIDWQIDHGVMGGWLRPPYGAYNSTVRSRARAQGYRICTWTFDTNDWKGYSAGSICDNVVRNASKGAVVLMHLNHSAANPKTLSCIVRGLRQRGHHICRPYTSTHPGRPTPLRLYNLPC